MGVMGNKTLAHGFIRGKLKKRGKLKNRGKYKKRGKLKKNKNIEIFWLYINSVFIYKNIKCSGE